MRRSSASASPYFFLSSLMCLLLTGCALGTSGPPTPEAGAAITGRVMGAQAPLIDAHLYLFAANAGVFTPNATGYGNASVSLLTSGTMDTSGGATNGDYYVTTSVATGTGSCPLGGCFSITSDYTCTAGEQVYLYSLGGSQGGVANPVGVCWRRWGLVRGPRARRTTASRRGFTS